MSSVPIQDFCFNCLKPLIKESNPFVHETQPLSVTYACGTTIEWSNYDKNVREWDITVRPKCKIKHEWYFDNEL